MQFDASNLEFIKPYDHMVRDLFKVGKELGNQYGDSMHATIGIVGECGELFMALGKGQTLEEMGDVEFYMEAFLQRTPGISSREDLEQRTIGLPAVPMPSLQTAPLVNATELLDAVKKGWVYNKDLDMNRIEQCWIIQRHYMDLLYHYTGIPRAVAMHANQMKLIGPKGRYPDGRYSDKAAQDRADKNGAQHTAEETNNDDPWEARANAAHQEWAEDEKARIMAEKDQAITDARKKQEG